MKWRELIFCLLEVHSLGLGRSLVRLPCRRLSPSLPTPPLPPLSSSPTSLSLSLCVAALLQLTLVLPLLGEVCVRLPKPGLISFLFPISSTSKKGEEGRKYCQPPQANNVWYGEGLEKPKVDIVAHCCTTTAKADALMLLTAVAFHSSHDRKSLHTPPKKTLICTPLKV